MQQNLPRAILADTIGTLQQHPDYKSAKHGDFEAAMRLAKARVTSDLVEQLRTAQADAVLGVLGEEAFGPNAIPTVAAAQLAKCLGIGLAYGIVKSTGPTRTSLSGLDRIFSRPRFVGKVIPGARYILLDDTLTQGGTCAALASFIEAQGGKLSAIVALTGKSYSSQLSLDEATLRRVRTKFGDLEDAFQQLTGHQFDALTESEARYLANFSPAEAVRRRITDATKH